MQEEDCHESRCALGQPSLQSDSLSNKTEVRGEKEEEKREGEKVAVVVVVGAPTEENKNSGVVSEACNTENQQAGGS